MNFGIKLSQATKAKNILLDKICSSCRWSSCCTDDNNKYIDYCFNPHNVTKNEFFMNAKSDEEKYVIILPEEKTCQRWESK